MCVFACVQRTYILFTCTCAQHVNTIEATCSYEHKHRVEREYDYTHKCGDDCGNECECKLCKYLGTWTLSVAVEGLLATVALCSFSLFLSRVRRSEARARLEGRKKVGVRCFFTAPRAFFFTTRAREDLPKEQGTKKRPQPIILKTMLLEFDIRCRCQSAGLIRRNKLQEMLQKMTVSRLL